MSDSRGNGYDPMQVYGSLRLPLSVLAAIEEYDPNGGDNCVVADVPNDFTTGDFNPISHPPTKGGTPVPLDLAFRD